MLLLSVENESCQHVKYIKRPGCQVISTAKCSGSEGKRLAAVFGGYGEIWIWDPATGQQLGKWQGNVLAALDPGVRVAAVGKVNGTS
jgi:hypothetical protein